MNYLSLIPKEVLYHCISGSSSPLDREALKIFICSGVRFTCEDLYKKTNQICQAIFLYRMAEFPEVHNASINFICRWLLGTPKINNSKLEEHFSLHSFSLDLLTEKMKSAELTPLFVGMLNSPATGLVCKDFQSGNLSLIDLKPLPSPVITHKIAPIFSDDNVVILFKDEEQYALHNGTLGKKFSNENHNVSYLPPIKSLQILENYIVFEEQASLKAITVADLDELKDVPSDLQGGKFLKSFKGEILFYKFDKEQKSAFHMLYVQDNQLKVNPCSVNRLDLISTEFFNWHHVFHKQSKHTVFYFNEFDGGVIGAISPNEINPSKQQFFHLHDKLPGCSGTLVAFKDTVLHCSIDKTRHLQIQRIDIHAGVITIVPLEIKNTRTLSSITKVYSHLDKLFITCTDADDYEWSTVSYMLTSVDMSTLAVDLTHEFDSTLDSRPDFISRDPGKILMTVTKKDTLSLLTIDYT